MKDQPVVIPFKAIHDDRGYLFEVPSERHPVFADGHTSFVQDNVSVSGRGVLRGLHYQLPPHEQGKLLIVLRGSIFDVAVDVRRGGSGFGSHTSFELHAPDFAMLWIPPGFAHGFLSLVDDTLVWYRLTTVRDPTSERSIRWDDPRVGIPWPLEGMEPILSERDKTAPLLADAEVPI